MSRTCVRVHFAFSYTHRPHLARKHGSEGSHTGGPFPKKDLYGENAKTTHETPFGPSSEEAKTFDLDKIPAHFPIQNRPPTNSPATTH